MKRPLSLDCRDNKAKHLKRAEESMTMGCDYIGYSFQKDPVLVETLDDASTIDPSEFFKRFIAKRKPCILPTNTTTTTTPPVPSISLQDLVQVAGQEVVQVEKRFSTNESFGQNRTKTRQLLMTMQDLVDKLRTTEGELLYLSTQQWDDPATKDDTANDDKDQDHDPIQQPPQPPNPFQTPCAQLLKANKIPATLPWASTLRLESCNLWMGRSSSSSSSSSSNMGSSSGLHHDYHDNFYLLLKGRKQFRLYSPDTAHWMSTYGTIERIHFNGVISYLGSEMHADGTPILKDRDDGSNDADDDEDDESEEEVVLGKGFDYKSDDDDDDDEDDDDDNDDDEDSLANVDVDGPDDFDTLVAASLPQSEGDTKENDLQQDESSRPNSFSRIDPANVDQEKFPHFGTCQEYIVELTAGQILYLPAGWFHCVTSYSSQTNGANDPIGNDNDPVHMALNYWYHPPDQLDSYTHPYRRDQSKSG